MKPFFGVSTIAIMIGLTTACSEAPSSTSNPKPVIVEDAKLTRDTYAMRGADQTWPGPASNELILADNLYAKNFYIIVDGSGSMNDSSCGNGNSRINVAKQSINAFFDAIPADTNTGLFVFDNNGSRQPQPLSVIDKPQLKAAVNRMRAGSGTPLGASIQYGFDQLTLQAQKQQGYGEYHMVIITDGEASDPRLMKQNVSNVLATSPVNIHTIGFCLDEGHSLNQIGYINYKSAFDSEELLQGLQSVLAEAESFNTNSFQGE